MALRAQAYVANENGPPRERDRPFPFWIVRGSDDRQANIDIATPEINAIKQSMTARTATMAKYFASGAIGFTADGMVDVRDQNLIPLPERNTVRKLVADDNKDRATLYAEVAKANGHPEWEADLKSTFAERWVANSPAGWWHRDSSGTWKQK